jgi:hypothetical protein
VLLVSEIGRKLRLAGRLNSRPLCVYGSRIIPTGVATDLSGLRHFAEEVLPNLK